MPENEQGNTPNGQADLLEQLLVVAAEKAAKREADDALRKGFVTREQINAAMSQLSDNLESSLVEKITASLNDTIAQSVAQTIEKTPGLKKSTIVTPEDEREADPVKFILKKSREQGAEALDDDEKRIVWGLTFAALSDGMNYVAGEEE